MPNSGVYKNVRVLIVEDEDTQRQLLYFMVVKLVGEVYTAVDGKDGLEKFKAHQPNLVITDLNMPYLDGIEMISKIKEINPNITTILISTLENNKIFESALNIKINRFLSKPINRELLTNYLRDFHKSIELKRKSEAEHLLHEQYQKIIDASMLVTKTDPKGNITYSNKKFARTSGYSIKELIGQPHSIVRHPETPNSVFEDMWETIKSKQTWRGTIKNRKKDGNFYIVSATVFPILDEDREISEFISIREDITDLYLNKEKERLEREKEHLDKLSQTKESFLVVFTHELKTPLNAIISFSQYVLKKIKKSEIQGKNELIELLGEVRQNANDMLGNITNILDISRLKSDRLQFNYTNFILEELLRDLNNQFVGMTNKEGIDVMFDLPHQTKIHCDKERIKQIISNIYSNAIKYGKDTILIRVVPDKNNFTLTIEDNGPGVKNPEKIFGLFEQDEENDFKRTAKGTGVGLHFTKMLCNSFNYKISITQSKELGGACFTISGGLDCQGENNV